VQPVFAEPPVEASLLAKDARHTLTRTPQPSSNTPQASQRPTKGNLMDKNIVLLIAGTVAVLFLKAILTRQRRPKNPFFSCGRCRKTTRHDNRTIGAWRAGKDRFFCASCHRTWLANHPAPSTPNRDVTTQRGGPEPRTNDEASRPNPTTTRQGQAAPPTKRDAPGPHYTAAHAGQAKSRGGCLGIALILVGLPAGLAIAWLSSTGG